MPRTSNPGGARILIDGLDSFGLEALEPLATSAARVALEGQRRLDPAGAEISVTFVDDDAIAALNREWLGVSGPTDVISFGLGEDPLVADVYVSVETARENARRFGVAPREELARLVLHGVLHAAGLDHPETEDRDGSPMFELQERLLRRLLGSLPDS